MKDLGPLKFFLGIQVRRTAYGFFLSQEQYASDILERSGMVNCKPASTPVDTKPKVSASAGASFSDPSLYRSIAGALQYLTITRPDLSYAVHQACLHMHATCDARWNLVKRILRDVRGTTRFGLQLRASASLELIAYSDADWAGCPDTRRSTSGYCIFFLRFPCILVVQGDKRWSRVQARKPSTEEWPMPLQNAAGCANCLVSCTSTFQRQVWSIVTTFRQYTCPQILCTTGEPSTLNSTFTSSEKRSPWVSSR
jgi:hypothetical protein